MNLFHSSELFGGFLVFVSLFIIIVLLDHFYNERKSNDVEKLSSERRHTLRFQLKRIVARLLLKLGKRKKTPTNVVDKLQVFADQDEMPVDAVFFNTSSEDGQILLFATARRKHGLVNTLGMLKVPEYSNGILVLPVFPKSSLYQTKEEQDILDFYTVAGLQIRPIIPEKEYRIEYNGKLVIDDSFRKEVDVQMSVVWRSNLPTFNFSTDLSPASMSEAMALESWSRKYFDNLKSHHQTHLEQFGDLEGVVKIDGKEYSLNTNGVRDHTIGARQDWNDFHRYVLHFIRLSNGNTISIGVISVPVMFTRLVTGFVTNATDKINTPIDSCTIDLNQFSKQNPTDVYEFDFIANNDSYRVHVKCHTQTTAYMGELMECCIIEKWCDCKVNGVRGWGAAEWQYRTEKNIQKF